MKMNKLSMLGLLVLGGTVLTALHAENADPSNLPTLPDNRPMVPDQYLPKLPGIRSIVPGKLTVQSIDELDISSDEKEKMRARARLLTDGKVIPASDDAITDFAAVEAEHRSRRAKLSELIAGKALKFSPVEIDATSLRGEDLIGSIPSGNYSDKSYSGLSRMFKHPHLGWVVLEETDLAKTGGGVHFTKESINADINGAPAMLLRKQGGPTRSETKVTWFSNGVMYFMATPRVDDNSRDELLEIARGLHK